MYSMVIILSNKRVICKFTISLIHKMATPMWSKMAAPMWTQDGLHKMASRGGQLAGSGDAYRDGNCRRPGQQGRTVRGNWASRGAVRHLSGWQGSG